MKRPSIWLLVALGLAALAAILGWLLLPGDAPPSATNEQAANGGQGPTPRAKALPPADQLALAFRTAFGASARRTVGDQSYNYVPERLEWIGSRAVLISLGRNQMDCHGCGGTMAIHYLESNGDGLQVSGAWLENDPSGSWGQPPVEVTIDRALADNLVVYSTGGWTGQGYSCTVAWLIELRPEGPVSSGPIPISYSNAGNVDEQTGRTFAGDPARELEGRIANIRRGQSFEIAFTGTERFSETYRYQGNRWVGPELESRAAC